ncbi:hypothetical protein PIB30_016408 [Stylosanthes scabra]|uniref:Uncharacterized protein n=1 Tax=Stylosanthes scabra TaxID=79078 RepID=A0ABU6U929_9FABA|nr:hypothetical protein [Stylosanthes scabra]
MSFSSGGRGIVGGGLDEGEAFTKARSTEISNRFGRVAVTADQFDAGDPTGKCIHCGARTWDAERLHKSKNCCNPRFGLVVLTTKHNYQFCNTNQKYSKIYAQPWMRTVGTSGRT